MTERALSHAEARAVYDRIGSRQDTQAFYEDQALAVSLRHGRFAEAQRVCELGCGTGRFAATLLDQQLPPDASYLGIDVSPEMVRLSRARLARFGDRAEIRQSEGPIVIDAPDGSVDRFVSNYVLDLLSVADIRAAVAEARRLLAPGGLACLVSLTRGCSPVSRALVGVWTRIHSANPKLVGGCRPVELLDFLPEAEWERVHHEVLSAFGVPSEVVVAARR